MGVLGGKIDIVTCSRENMTFRKFDSVEVGVIILFTISFIVSKLSGKFYSSFIINHHHLFRKCLFLLSCSRVRRNYIYIYTRHYTVRQNKPAPYLFNLIT